MQIGDLLPGVGTGIHDTAKTCGSDALHGSHFSSRHQQAAEDLSVFVLSILQTPQSLPWNDEDVHRRLRLNVSESDAILVLIDDVGGNLAA